MVSTVTLTTISRLVPPAKNSRIPVCAITHSRNGLPTAIFRQLYQGVPASKSSRIQVDESCGLLTTRSEVDQDMAELGGNAAAYRVSEQAAFYEAFGVKPGDKMYLPPERREIGRASCRERVYVLV